MTSLHSLTTPTLSTHHALLTLNTPDSLLSQHTTNSQLSPHNKFPYHTLPILSPHTLHFLAAHSPLSYYSLIPLPSLSPYYTIPTLFYHTPDSYVRTSLLSHLPTLSPHIPLFYLTSYSRTSLIPHSRTSVCYRTFPLSLRSQLSHHTPPFLTLHSFISLPILSHHHPCSQGGHWDD